MRGHLRLVPRLRQQPGDAAPASGSEKQGVSALQKERLQKEQSQTPAPQLASGLYSGHVRHRRFTERAHAFEYRVFMVYLDLAEIEAVCAQSRWWSAQRFAPAWFRRADFLPGHPGDLRTAVLGALAEKGADTTGIGAIRVLTHLRYWGLSFNPISIFYCFAADGVTLKHTLLEVHNTPWNERHLYLLNVPAVSAAPASNKSGSSAEFHRNPPGVHEADIAKAFHVSPFMPMDMRYHFRFNTPAEQLFFHMENRREGERAFDATLSLRRQAISPDALDAVLLRHPWMSAKIIAGIYWQATRLLLKGVGFHPHPDR